MNPSSSINASMWLMLAVQTIGAVDMPHKGPRKLPAPRVYAAVVIVWGSLHLADDAGWGKGAATVGWVLVGTALLLGPAGKTVVDFLNSAAGNLAPTTATPYVPPTSTIPGTATPGGTVNA